MPLLVRQILSCRARYNAKSHWSSQEDFDGSNAKQEKLSAWSSPREDNGNDTHKFCYLKSQRATEDTNTVDTLNELIISLFHFVLILGDREIEQVNQIYHEIAAYPNQICFYALINDSPSRRERYTWHYPGFLLKWSIGLTRITRHFSRYTADIFMHRWAYVHFTHSTVHPLAWSRNSTCTCISWFACIFFYYAIYFFPFLARGTNASTCMHWKFTPRGRA
jgi:hypothetical protein